MIKSIAIDNPLGDATGSRLLGAASSLFAGLVVGVFTIVACVSFAALIFAGDLAPHLQDGIGSLLFAAAVSAVVVGFGSSYGGTVAMPQDRVAPLVALMASGVAGGAGTLDGAAFSTVVAIIVTSTLATGVFFYLLGTLRLGRLIRFVPYPVVGGFLAGTGWLLVLGALRVLSGMRPSLSNIGAWTEVDALLHWVPGLLFGVLLFFVARRVQSPAALPAVLAAGVGLFHLLSWGLGIGLEKAQGMGLVLGPLPSAEGWTPHVLAHLAETDWAAVLAQAGIMGSLLLVAMVSLLLNASALELSAECDMDLDRELRTAGLANLIVGAGGGMASFHSLSMSNLALSLGARNWIAPVTVGLLSATALVFGTGALELIPLAVVGGLLTFLGLDFLHRWIVRGYQELSRPEYGIVWLILGVIGFVGYLEGVAVGLGAALVLFVVNYSRVGIIKQTLTGTDMQSRVDRTPAEQRVLAEQAESILILKLHGFIFFGTANHLLDRIRCRLAVADQPPLAFVVVDFQQVTGLDSSTRISFQKLRLVAREKGVMLLFCGLLGTVKESLERSGVIDSPVGLVVASPDLDHALEYCEGQLLRMAQGEQAPAPSAEHCLAEAIDDPTVAKKLLPHLQRIELKANEYLIRQGDQAAELYFLAEGQLSIRLETAESSLRLRKVSAGNFVGEIAVYLGGRRSASVLADGPAVVLAMPAERLKQLEFSDPLLVAQLHRAIARVLARRLLQANRTLEHVLQ